MVGSIYSVETEIWNWFNWEHEVKQNELISSPFQSSVRNNLHNSIITEMHSNILKVLCKEKIALKDLLEKCSEAVKHK